MKTLLSELVNPNTAILNDTQKAVLIITHISPTPQVAYDNTVPSENLAAARDSLVKMQALRLGENTLEMTSRGQNMLKYHNLVDEMGELTDEANEILQDSQTVGQSFNDQTIRERFSFLSKLNNL